MPLCSTPSTKTQHASFDTSTVAISRPCWRAPMAPSSASRPLLPCWVVLPTGTARHRVLLARPLLLLARFCVKRAPHAKLPPARPLRTPPQPPFLPPPPSPAPPPAPSPPPPHLTPTKPRRSSVASPKSAPCT